MYLSCLIFKLIIPIRPRVSEYLFRPWVGGALKCVISRILDTIRLVRHYELKTKFELRNIWLDTFQLIVDNIGTTINSDSMGPLYSDRPKYYVPKGAQQVINTLGLGLAMSH